MLQINPNVTSAYGSHRAKFGQRESEISRITQILTEENNTGKSDDEFKAEKLEKLADARKHPLTKRRYMWKLEY